MIGIKVISPNEHNCLENLEQYEILNAKTDLVFDKLVAMMVKMWNVPLGIINFIDNPAVWGTAEQLENSVAYTSKDRNICSIAIQKDRIVKFEELTKNPGLILNPIVLGEHGLNFFASAPIITSSGLHVGTLCIASDQWKDFNSVEQEKLEFIATMVTNEMNRRMAVNAVA